MNRRKLTERQLEAEYRCAFSLGLVSSPSPSDAMERRQCFNLKGRADFGTRFFSEQAFFLHEINTFRLLYAEEASVVRHIYRKITEEERLSFFEANMDLFTRYHGDSFSFDDVRDVITKKIREAEYDELVRSYLLCEQ